MIPVKLIADNKLGFSLGDRWIRLEEGGHHKANSLNAIYYSQKWSHFIVLIQHVLSKFLIESRAKPTLPEEQSVCFLSLVQLGCKIISNKLFFLLLLFGCEADLKNGAHSKREREREALSRYGKGVCAYCLENGNACKEILTH